MSGLDGVMKIEIGEALCYSYLRHVQQCWVVQANWKVSEHWGRLLSDDELEGLFRSMRERFAPDSGVFKGTKDSRQFLKQGEIDVVGVGQDGSVHAMEVAFHENGLAAVGGPDKRVLKKMLRILLILEAYHPAEVERHVYFVSPKVRKGVQGPLEEMFEILAAEYPTVDWHLLTNEEFHRKLLVPTLEKAGTVSDTSELFVRAAKLLELGKSSATGYSNKETDPPTNIAPTNIEGTTEGLMGLGKQSRADRAKQRRPQQARGELQRIVQSLMSTLLDDYPGLLGETDLRNLLDSELCKDNLGLQLGGFPLLG